MRFARKDENRVTFEIRAENRAEVLPRVVMLLHRLHLEIVALYLVRRPNARTLHLDVTLDADERLWRRAEASLSKIVEVREVRTITRSKELLPGWLNTGETRKNREIDE